MYLAEIKKEQIKIGKDNVEVSLGSLRGNFPNEGNFALEFDTFALFYITTEEGEGKNKIVAVDAVYPEKKCFRSARLLGNIDEIPMVTGESQITTWLKSLPSPRRRIRISVVKCEGEQLFESGAVMFDLLHAHYKFEKGQLSIIRNGEVIDRTEEIDEFGTHGACTCFLGLKKFFKNENSYRSKAVSALEPKDFQIGDIIFLDILVFQNFDFVTLLKQSACFQSAISQVFKEKSELSFPEMEERLSKEIASTAGGFMEATIIRFREKKK